VIPVSCQTCGALLPIPDEASVPRCAECGAPQIRISQDILAEAAAQREHYEKAVVSGTSQERPSGEIKWKRAIALSAAVASAAVLLCAVIPPLVVVAWIVPIPVLLIYRARFPRAALTGLIGARIGALLGLFCCAGAALLGTAYLLVQRFGLHRLAGFDALYANALATAQKQAIAQSGPSITEQAAAFATPEFRSGLMLAGMLMAAVIFTMLCTACGALSAALQRQHQVDRAA
jgi:4-hydroxybenzoate polyprenyltransferase